VAGRQNGRVRKGDAGDSTADLFSWAETKTSAVDTIARPRKKIKLSQDTGPAPGGGRRSVSITGVSHRSRRGQLGSLFMLNDRDVNRRPKRSRDKVRRNQIVLILFVLAAFTYTVVQLYR
jgi:hypothetical protein